MDLESGGVYDPVRLLALRVLCAAAVLFCSCDYTTAGVSVADVFLLP
jgi:hypothetical protein